MTADVCGRRPLADYQADHRAVCAECGGCTCAAVAVRSWSGPVVRESMLQPAAGCPFHMVQ